MREIKFRAWYKEKKEMREVAMLRWENGELCRIAGYWPGTRDNGWTDHDPKEGKYILMQFTGLQDKNAIEIYEGDVVEFKDHLHEVDFFGGGWMMTDIKKNGPDKMSHGLYFSGSPLEVVGNIYEWKNFEK